jgi:hypothetical protein
MQNFLQNLGKNFPNLMYSYFIHAFSFHLFVSSQLLEPYTSNCLNLELLNPFIGPLPAAVPRGSVPHQTKNEDTLSMGHSPWVANNF